ncbi:MAG: peptidoglycan DD-metalloendopeptidase family protein [bacterium]|nr:peptidoglycan DD-metalloendopeptidase family protein [bacterium]
MKKRIALLLILAVFLLPLFTRRVKGDTPQVKENSDLVGVRYVLKRGDTVIDILRKSHIEKAVIDSVVKVFEENVDPKTIKVGEEIFIFTDKSFNFKKLEYRRNLADIYTIEFEENFKSKKKEIKKSVSVALIEGEVASNLYYTFKIRGERDELASTFAKVFEWQFDAYSEIQNGDRYTILVEKIFMDDKFYSYGKILYASFENRENLFEAFYYGNDSTGGYFDENGNSLSGTIMKAPLASYTRVSSKFTTKRFHPIMKKYLPHEAVDYSAPKGTVVFAAGDGIVIQKGFNAIGGRTIKIKHENGYVTEYCHLNKYAPSVKEGKFVKQGETIGFVGRTGYATGNHLHYAVSSNGKYINPLKMKFETSSFISEDAKTDYILYVDIVRSFILAAKSILNFPALSSKKDFIFKYSSPGEKNNI